MEVFIEREEYTTMALMDTGSEINIIPEEIAIKASLASRKLNMNLRGIGGHTTFLVGLSEFTPITMITGEEKEIHLFIAKVSLQTILGRPFLADNNVKFKFSHKQGEIFSYPDEEPKDKIIKPLEKRKLEKLENESSLITEDKIDQVGDRDIEKGVKQRMETVPEGELVESEDDLKLSQQNNVNWEDKYKQERRFEDLEEGDLSKNTQRLAGLSILEEFNDVYEKICCFSSNSFPSSTDLINQNPGITSELTNGSQNQNGIQEDIPEYEGEEDYVILSMITFEELNYYELDSPIIQTKYLSELPGSNVTNVDFLELLTTI
ncbi:hypothetical protein O181_112967 [Austropuccinia psidii MF-1]|uniref:Peptidase A2 domain-containing protein n=1 Tax=Austropuccinia psidii MF-1 TaxID=1389203 RepID=A0A9Q3K2S8_9BASI|nr:hypothetical protein [Austropuccinia psidii MF-1]